MCDLVEVIFTSDTSGHLWNSCVWDPRTGTNLMCYKGGGVAAPNTLHLIGSDYIVTADSLKPLLHVWPLNSQEKVQNIKFVCPGRVNALTISPDSNYCVAAVDEKIHVWQIASGRLLSVVSRHFQSVTRLKFIDDGSHFISSGEDGMVLVWPLANLIAIKGNLFSQKLAGQNDPRYTFSDHSLPVRDLYVGKGGLKSRFISVSSDRTCKMYDLGTGTMLLSLVFDVGLTSVIMNRVETDVFVGATNGKIYQFGLTQPPRTLEYHLNSNDKTKVFIGHEKSISCLSLSLDGITLLSGADDKQIIIWHIPSRQKIRTIQHKGVINNAFFSLAYGNIFIEQLKPTVVLHDFKRSMEYNESDEYVVEIFQKDKFSLDRELEIEKILSYKEISDESNLASNNLQDEIDRLKKINAELYKVAVGKVIADAKTTSVQEETNSTALIIPFKVKKRRKKKKKMQV